MKRSTFLFGMASLPFAFSIGGSAVASTFPDAKVELECAKFNNFLNWLGNKKGYIGEMGWPSNLGSRANLYPDQEKWRRLGAYWFRQIGSQDVIVTMHHSYGEHFARNKLGGNFASMYLTPGDGTRVVDHPAYQAKQLEYQLQNKAVGLNFPGGQLGTKGEFSNSNPGVHGKDYAYPTMWPDSISPNTRMNSWEYLVSRGHTIARTGLRWERLQPKFFQPLDSKNLSYLKGSIRKAREAGLKLIIDIHNDGEYRFSDGSYQLNSSRVPVEAYLDFVGRLANEFKYWEAVHGIDLMNEPTNSGVVGKAAAWEGITQRAVDTIRATGNRKEIMVPIYGWPRNLPAIHRNGPWIRNGGAIRYTIHQYVYDLKEILSYDEELKLVA